MSNDHTPGLAGSQHFEFTPARDTNRAIAELFREAFKEINPISPAGRRQTMYKAQAEAGSKVAAELITYLNGMVEAEGRHSEMAAELRRRAFDMSRDGLLR